MLHNFDSLLAKYESYLLAGKTDELLTIVKNEIDWSDFPLDIRNSAAIELVNELMRRYTLNAMAELFGGAVEAGFGESSFTDEFSDTDVPEPRAVEFVVPPKN